MGSAAVDYRHDTERPLWIALFQLAQGKVPSASLNLEAPNVGAFFAWWKILLPVKFLQYVGLHEQLVEFLLLFSRIDLGDGRKEGLGVEQPVDEGDMWHLDRILFPEVQLLESLPQVV